VQSSVTIPIMLLALFSGAVADSYDRRRIMLIAQFLMLMASVILTMLTVMGYVGPVSLLLLTLTVGIGTSLNGPAWQASIRDQVPAKDIPAAVSLNSIGFNLARSLGPALGGATMVIAGPAANFAINSCTYLLLIAVLLRWRPEARPLPRREPLIKAIGAGIHHAWENQTIRRALIRTTWFGVMSGAFLALLPLVAKTLMGGDQFTFGLLLGAFGVGSVAGALIAVRLRAKASNEIAYVVSNLLYAGATFAVAYLANPWIALPLVALGGIGWVVANSTINIVVQFASAAHVVGRSISLYHMLTFGGMAIGSYCWGLLADNIGLAEALSVSGTMLVAGNLLGLLIPLTKDE
jgi:MFS family permease